MTENQIKESANNVIAIYGSDTIAAKFAKHVLNYLEKDNLDPHEADPDFPYGSYTHSLPLENNIKLKRI